MFIILVLSGCRIPICSLFGLFALHSALVLIVAVAQSSFDHSVIRYVLPVLWMASWLSIIG